MKCVKLYISEIYKMNFNDFKGFDWDEGNSTKNWDKHQVSRTESEQVFFNQPLLLYPDTKHSEQEPRFFVLGRTDDDRFLMIVFTARGDKVRVISARPMSKNERAIYEEAAEV